MAYGTLAPQPGIKIVPLELETWSPNHWIAREVPQQVITRELPHDCLQSFDGNAIYLNPGFKSKNWEQHRCPEMGD